MFKPHELAHIKYKGETDQRVVIPTYVPSTNMKAIDVTALSDDERDALQILLRGYDEYYKACAKNIFSFEDWMSHVTGETNLPEVSWRTFRLENTEKID